MKRSFLWKVVINAFGLFLLAEYLIKGLHFADITTLFIAAAVLGVVNAFIRPIILVLSLPINLLTLGLFTLVINGFMLLITDSLVAGFTIDKFSTAVLAALLLSVISYILNTMQRD